ncbi:MAG: radical SAM protein [Candidatus Woesearchaeota archaeon]|nr:radical SAM protein [Candidatus Woesearchaeota archaeon]
MQVEKTKWHSWCTGKLAKGCRQCVEGRKLVLFITGLCAQRCWYCPVSEQKFGKDVVFANEWQINNIDNPIELIKEAELTKASGAGITGGDPLAQTERCCKYIRLLKERFGTRFHVHLYTPLKLVTKERLEKLFSSGLDEIRLHPDLDDNLLWERINLVCSFDWSVGIEIPAIPDYEDRIKRLIDFAYTKIDFLNLNELERSDTITHHYTLDSKGFKQKSELSYGIKGSKETALKILEYSASKGLPAHFCTAKLKDSVQVINRLKIRAQNVCTVFDEVSVEGLLIRPCVYLASLVPGMDYKKNLKENNVKETAKRLSALQAFLSKKYGAECMIDSTKPRVFIAKALLIKSSRAIKKAGFVPTIVTEYPTSDALEVEVDFL